MRRALGAAALAVALAAACARKPVDATPEGAVRELLDRMERVDGDPAAGEAAYQLLAESARANLGERSRRASAASGRPVKPWEMLAPSRFTLRFAPRSMVARAAGDKRAIVEVTGADPEVERARVPCVLEGGGWRVDLQLPELPPIERRPDAGS